MKLTGFCLQLLAIVKQSSSKGMADAKGKSHVDRGDVKMKGKSIVGELPASSCRRQNGQFSSELPCETRHPCWMWRFVTWIGNNQVPMVYPLFM